MGNYLLLLQSILLALLAFVSYVLYGQRLTSPTFISAMIFSVGSMVAYIGNKNWKIDIIEELLYVILLGNVMMFLAEYIVRALYQQRNGLTFRSNEWCLIEIPNNVLICMACIGVLANILYYIRMCQMAGTSLSNPLGMIAAINSVRHASDESVGIHIAILNVAMACSMYYCVGAFINNAIVTKACGILEKKYYSYLIMVIPYVIYIFIGGSRIFFISLLSYVLFSIAVMNEYYCGNKAAKRTVKQIFKVFVVGMLLLFCGFTFIGQLNGKITENNGPFDSFMVYMASSIVDLSKYIQNGVVRDSIPGRVTFAGMFNTIERFVNLPPANNLGMGYIRLNTGTITNVYTAFGSYLADFGFVGTMILEFILGGVYTVVFIIICNRKFKHIGFRCYMITWLYGLIGQLFAPETLSGRLSVNDICAILIYILFAYTFDTDKYRVEIKIDP